MENSICNFTIIESPNKRYANTVNIVFFRAIPLTKNFQKYIDGLIGWKQYMKEYPDSQLQIFVDRAIAEDKEVAPILHSLGARIYLFDCPDFTRSDKYHKGLFGTLVRFFPIFDINTHALSVAHIQELEPAIEFSNRFSQLDKMSKLKTNHDMTLLYSSNNLFEQVHKNQPTFENGIFYPWILAGRFTILKHKMPIKLLEDYLKDVKEGKKFFNRYEGWNEVKQEHENFSFGVDESFLNISMLQWIISKGYGIGIIQNYYLSHAVYYLKYKILNDSRSKDLFNFILQKKQSLKDSMYEFDKMFYRKTPTDKNEYVERFFEVVKKYPSWLGSPASSLLVKVFNNRVSRKCLIIVKNGKIVEIKDLR